MGDKYAVRNIRFCEKDCLCLYVCPTGASDTENSVIDVEKCIGCGACARACPRRIIRMTKDGSAPEVKKPVKKAPAKAEAKEPEKEAP